MSLVTAISPRAVLDVIFVVAQIIRLVRRIAEIYGGRPGLLGLIKLARSIGAHIAITGGMAVGDSLIQQLVGHGIASRISAKMGEGVLNGLLTARVGLSALAVCRPAPFAVDEAPRRLRRRAVPVQRKEAVRRCRYGAGADASAAGAYSWNSQRDPPSSTAARARASPIGSQASPSAVLRRSLMSGAGM